MPASHTAETGRRDRALEQWFQREYTNRRKVKLPLDKVMRLCGGVVKAFEAGWSAGRRDMAERPVHKKKALAG